MNGGSKAGLSRFSTEVDEALELLGPVMRPKNPSLLGPEYPLVYSMPDRGRVRVLQKEGRSVSGAVYVLFQAITDPVTCLQIGAVGSVGTHPDFRGKGFAAEVMRECEESIHREGGSIALLWSQVPEVFRKLGYTEAGVEVDYLLDVEAADLEKPGGVVSPFEKEKDLKICFDLYRQHPVRVERSAEEFSRLVDIPGMRIWVHRRLGKICAYGIVGKGTDFPETMHEWGGDSEGVFAIAQHHLREAQSGALVVISSGASTELQSSFKKRAIDPVYGIMGLFKILDRARLAESLAPFFWKSYGVRLEAREEGFFLSNDSGEFEAKDSEFLKLLFGYRGLGGVHFESAKRLSVPAWKKAVPLKLFFWGLDSI